MCWAMGCSVVWKPVATTMASTSRTVPSWVTIPVGVISAMPSVTRSTWSCGERGVVVVRDQDALAADLVVGRDRRAQLRVGDAALRCSAGRASSPGRPAWGSPRSRARSTRDPSRCRCGRPSGRTARSGSRASRSPGRGGPCAASPRGRCAGRRRGGRPAWRSPGRSGSTEAPVPITATRLPAQVVVVVPAGGVEDLALEGVDAGDLGQLRLGEPAGAGDHDVGDHGAVVGGHVPDAGRPRPRRASSHGDAEAEPVEHARLARRCARGRRGSPAAGRTSATSSGWARS